MKGSWSRLPLELQQMIIHHTITNVLEDEILDCIKQRSRLLDLAETPGYHSFRQPLEAAFRAQQAVCEELQQSFDLVDKKTSHRTIARWRTAQGLFISEACADYDATLNVLVFNVQRRNTLKNALLDVKRHLDSVTKSAGALASKADGTALNRGN